MNLLVSLEHRFKKTPDGTVWSQTMFPYSFWTRYLEVFDQVNVLARIKEENNIPSNWNQASGKCVNFLPIPYYEGPYQFLCRYKRIERVIREALSSPFAIIMRVSSPIAAILESNCRKNKRPYGVEVVGDPYDVFSPGAIKHPLRPFLRWFSYYQLKRQCANAIAALYVTEYALQKRYPCPGFSIGVSDVILSDNFIINKAKSYSEKKPLTIITVGSLNHFYKAQDVLIDAVGQCVRAGLDLKLVIVGGGKYLEELKARAESQGLTNRCNFTGQITCGIDVIDQLDKADLFILPSRQEGLPRAMIEAMARGLPCIGSTVGGIPELLPPEDLVIPNDVIALTKKIIEVAKNPERLATMSARNLFNVNKFREEVLSKKRLLFYHYVKDRCEELLKR